MRAMKAEPQDKLPAPRQAQEPTATPAASREIYDYAALADALNTQRSYLSDWKHFVSWCQVRRFSPLPCNPDQLAAVRALLRREARSKDFHREPAAGCH